MSEDVKCSILDSNSFTSPEKDQIGRSNLSFLNITYGVVPLGLEPQLMIKILQFQDPEDPEFSKRRRLLPLLPFVQRSWNGTHLADWLISSKLIDVSKLEIISKKLNGDLFLNGRVLNVLTQEEMDHIFRKCSAKVCVLLDNVWDFTRDSDLNLSACCDLFEISPDLFISIDSLEKVIMQKYLFNKPSTLASCPSEADPNLERLQLDPRLELAVQDAFERPYLDLEISEHFIDYIENLIRSDPGLYFACYAFLGQSSCVGKSRLLSEPLESKDKALFILNINCKSFEDQLGFPHTKHQTSLFVEEIMSKRSELEMTKLIMLMLCCVISNAFDIEADGNYYLKKDIKLSSTLEDLQISKDDILNHTEVPGYSASILREISGKFKVRREKNGQVLIKKAIFIVAFDEAGRFIDTSFLLEGLNNSSNAADESLQTPQVPEAPHVAETPQTSNDLYVAKSAQDSEPSKAPVTINTFRLIRRTLCVYKARLWEIPFIFSGTNTRFGNFVPEMVKDPSARANFDAKDGKAGGGLKLFDPYVLLSPFDVYAKMFNYGPRLDDNWKDYISTPNYQYHICNYGRPMWGAILSSQLSRLFRDQFIEDSRNGRCIPVGKEHLLPEVFHTVISNAVVKISYMENNPNIQDRTETAVAILLLITGSGFIHGTIAKSLAEKRMGVLLDYQCEGSQIRVMYPSEPVLALVALECLHKYPVPILTDILRSYDCFLGHEGDIGEFGARIIFLLALERDPNCPAPLSLLKSPVSLERPYCPLKLFLRNLIGVENYEYLELKAKEDEKLQNFINGFVCFSHFAKANEILEKPLNNIAMLVNLNAALITPRNYKGIDNMIPVVLMDGKLGCIYVQIKSFSKRLGPMDISNIKGSIVSSGLYSKDIPSLNLIINVGPKHPYECKVFDPEPLDNGIYTIVIYGIMFHGPQETTPNQKKSDQMPALKKLKAQDIIEQLLCVGRHDSSASRENVKQLPISLMLPMIESRIREIEEDSETVELECTTKSQSEDADIDNEFAPHGFSSQDNKGKEVHEGFNVMKISGNDPSTRNSDEMEIDQEGSSSKNSNEMEIDHSSGNAKRIRR